MQGPRFKTWPPSKKGRLEIENWNNREKKIRGRNWRRGKLDVAS